MGSASLHISFCFLTCLMLNMLPSYSSTLCIGSIACRPTLSPTEIVSSPAPFGGSSLGWHRHNSHELRLPSTIRWSDGTCQPVFGDVPSMLHPLMFATMAQMDSAGRVLVQHKLPLFYASHSIRGTLRPPSSPFWTFRIFYITCH
jgi:hypothetical protein